jgi:hypothetical protein
MTISLRGREAALLSIPRAGCPLGFFATPAEGGAQAKARYCDGHHSLSPGRRHNSVVGVNGGNARPREIVMIKTRNRMFGAVGLLLSVVPTAALASVSKPTAEERGACMGDAISLCISAIPNKARIASCLASKMSQLSPRCRAQFDKASTGR